MGQTSGTTANKQFSSAALKNFQDKYVFVSEKNDQRWGTIQVWKEKISTEHVMIITKNFYNETEYKDFLEEIKERFSLDHENLVQFLGWFTENADGICGHSRKVSLYVQYFSQNLQKELDRRTLAKEFFEESELWYLGRSAVELGAYLQLNHISHGDFRPVQLLLTETKNEEGQLRMADNGVMGQFRSGYNLTLSGAGRGFLTPVLMRSYSRKEVRPEYNVYKADVYSLGMTLLQAATLRDPNRLFYDWIAHDVQSDAIETALKDVEVRYSHELARYIATMLDEDEVTRPDFLGIGKAPAPLNTGVHFEPMQSVIKPILQQAPVVFKQAPVQTVPLQQAPVLIKPAPVQAVPVQQQSPVYYSQAPLTYSQAPIQQNYVPTSYVHPLQTSNVLPQARYASGKGISYVSQVSPQKRFENVEDLSDLDRRVQEAIRTTEETINRNNQIPNLAETQAFKELGKE